MKECGITHALLALPNKRVRYTFDTHNSKGSVEGIVSSVNTKGVITVISNIELKRMIYIPVNTATARMNKNKNIIEFEYREKFSRLLTTTELESEETYRNSIARFEVLV